LMRGAILGDGGAGQEWVQPVRGSRCRVTRRSRRSCRRSP
jgi:hypothetical protein